MTSKPFHELDYAWDFGDTTAGVWNYGTASTSKNVPYGPVTVHVFETPGTYTVTLSVYDDTEATAATTTITVQDPDVVFASSTTVCVNNVGDFDFSSCPSAEESSHKNTDDYITAQGYITGSVKRLLYKSGGTWTKVTTTASTTPTNNVSAPINISAIGQEKTGGLWVVGTLAVTGKAVSASTRSTDPGNTLVTKDYIDDKIPKNCSTGLQTDSNGNFTCVGVPPPSPPVGAWINRSGGSPSWRASNCTSVGYYAGLMQGTCSNIGECRGTALPRSPGLYARCEL